MDIYRINRYRKEIMGIAALWIFYFHVGPVLFETSNLTFLKNFAWYIRRGGYCGVEIFLFLSGMGLVYAIRKQSIKTFYIRRFLRVYPAFWIWFTASTLGRHDYMSFIDYLKRITFYANWTQDLLAYKWYIAAICMLYFWFPFYYRIFDKVKNPLRFTIILTLMEFCLPVFCSDYIRGDLLDFFNRIPIFLIGVLIGYYCIKFQGSKIMKYRFSLSGWIVMICSLILIVICNFFIHKTEMRGVYDLLRVILNDLLAILSCFIWAKFFEVFEKTYFVKKISAGLRFLGTLSLEFYLTHELVSLKVQSYHLRFVPFEKLNEIIELILCFGVSLFAAWILSNIVYILLRKDGEYSFKRTFEIISKYLTKSPKSHML